MSYELPDPRRDEDDCGCRSSATCARHLADADLTLTAVPMGTQTKPEEEEDE